LHANADSHRDTFLEITRTRIFNTQLWANFYKIAWSDRSQGGISSWDQGQQFFQPVFLDIQQNDSYARRLDVLLMFESFVNDQSAA